ncbi:MAG TPA: ABA4-like family protein [Vicinamibacterales bacterium]|nr:ABA4-like family protein [Vicinamibacterales bacterium]
MTPDQVFSAVNLVALAGWVLLAVLPGRSWANTIAAAVIPSLLAAVYTGIVAVQWGGSEGGFDSLEQVARLFANRWLLLAGWVHYLAFDLFLGSWEARDARLHGIPHWLVLPCLLLTFLFGPAGWLLYMIVRAARGKTVAVA